MDRFYYNLGDFFMEMDEHADGVDHFFALGVIVGNFYEGLKSVIEDEVMTFELTSQFIDNLELVTGMDEDGDELE